KPVYKLNKKIGINTSGNNVWEENANEFQGVQFVVNVFDLTAQMVPAESASLVFPIDVIHLAGNMPDFTTSSPIGPVSGHLSLHMRKHAVDMVNLVCRLVLPRWLVVRALVVTVFLFLRESRNASQTQPQHND